MLVYRAGTVNYTDITSCRPIALSSPSLPLSPRSTLGRLPVYLRPPTPNQIVAS